MIRESKHTATKVIKSQKKAARAEQGTNDLQNSQKQWTKWQ